MSERSVLDKYKKIKDDRRSPPDAEFLTDRDNEGLDDPLTYEPLRSITGKQ